MPELLYEIGCEELPATFVAPTMAQMEQGFREKFAAAKLWNAESGTVCVYGTPRRLVLYATGLAARQADETLSVKGPSQAVAFDTEGKPTKAALGFAQKNTVPVEELAVVDGYVQATVTRAGRDAGRNCRGTAAADRAGIDVPQSHALGGRQAALRPAHSLDRRPAGWRGDSLRH